MKKVTKTVGATSGDKVSVIQEWEQYEGHVSAPVLKLIASAEGKSPQEQIGIYQKAWEQASAIGVLEGVEDKSGMVYALVKWGDACLACAAGIYGPGPTSTSGASSSYDLDGLAKRWQSNYSLASRFYAVARVKAEEYKCANVFGTELFPKRMSSLMATFIKQECVGITYAPKLDYIAYLEQLKKVRGKVKEKAYAKDVVAKDLLAHITGEFKSMVASMVPDCIKVLGKPPCSYAIIGLGSMSRNEMGPFSDVELAVILERSDDKTRDYFYKLMCLVEWKITCIGETELPRTLGVDTHSGFGIDIGGNIPGHKIELMGTVEELVKQQVPPNRGGDLITLNALRTVCLVDGDESIVRLYRQKLAIRLDDNYQPSKKSTETKKIREGRTLELFRNDLFDFEPVLGQQKEEEQFNIKKELYRLPSNLANYLALYYGVDAQSSWEKLDQLVDGGLITPEARRNIVELLNFATIMRIKTHCFYGYEKEDVYHKRLLNDENGLKRPLVVYEISDEEQKSLELSYRVLIPIHRGIKDFTDKKAPKDFKQLTLFEDSLYVQGLTASKMLRYQEASECYEKALSLDPENVEMLSVLGVDRIKLSSKYALELAKKALALAIKKSWDKEPGAIEHRILAICNNNLGMAFMDQGKGAEALKCCMMALVALKQAFDEEDAIAAVIYNNIGRALWSQGNYDQALEYYSKALTICLNNGALTTAAKIYNNIGVALTAQGIYTEAFSCVSRALKIREEVYGKFHPEVAESNNNIGYILQAQGKPECAIEYYYRALSVEIAVYGKEHPSVARSYHNVGAALREQDRYDEALEYYFRALAIDEKHYKEHADTAISCRSIGGVLLDKGEAGQALQYYFKALEIEEKVLGLEHPDVARSYNGIGMVLWSQGQYDQALEYYLKALEVEEKSPDKEYHSSKSCNNIALAFQMRGMYSHALTLHLKVLTVTEKALGKNHPHIALCCNNIASVLGLQGKYNQALGYYRRALAIQEEASSNRHDITATTYSGIGYILYSQGKYNDALEPYLKSVEIYDKLGQQGHPNAARSYNDIGQILFKIGKYREALDCYQKALAIFESKWGLEHPHTIAVQRHIELAQQAKDKLGRDSGMDTPTPKRPVSIWTSSYVTGGIVVLSALLCASYLRYRYYGSPGLMSNFPSFDEVDNRSDISIGRAVFSFMNNALATHNIRL